MLDNRAVRIYQGVDATDLILEIIISVCCRPVGGHGADVINLRSIRVRPRQHIITPFSDDMRAGVNKGVRRGPGDNSRTPA